MDSVSPFSDFLDKNIKAVYQDGGQFKIARGVLGGINSGFLRINGRLGTIIINERNIQKLSEAKS